MSNIFDGANPSALIEQNMIQNALAGILKTSATSSRNDAGSPKNQDLRTPRRASGGDQTQKSITSSPAKASGSRLVKIGFSDEETTIRTIGTKQG